MAGRAAACEVAWPSLKEPSVARKYLIQRIPEIAEVDVADPDDLVDEGRDRQGKFYHRRGA